MKTAEEYLAASQYCVLSTVDDEGNPWGAPVFFVHDENKTLYWWSDTEAQHSRNIDANGQVYINVFDSTLPEGKGEGIYLRCEAGRVPKGALERVRELYNQHVKTFALSPEDVSGDAPTQLYQAVPQLLWQNAPGSRDGKYIDIREEIA